MTELDFEDLEILNRRQLLFDKKQGPRVGDFVIFPDGTFHRFTEDWGEDIQTVAAGQGSFYLGDGYMDYSGGLDPAIPKTKLSEVSGQTRRGWCWFFHHGRAMAHNGVHTTVFCRLYRYSGA
jgi:hypothetical protein